MSTHGLGGGGGHFDTGVSFLLCLRAFYSYHFISLFLYAVTPAKIHTSTRIGETEMIAVADSSFTSLTTSNATPYTPSAQKSNNPFKQVIEVGRPHVSVL